MLTKLSMCWTSILSSNLRGAWRDRASSAALQWLWRTQSTALSWTPWMMAATPPGEKRGEGSCSSVSDARALSAQILMEATERGAAAISDQLHLHQFCALC